MKRLTFCLKQLTNGVVTTIVAGDFNLPGLDWETGTYPTDGVHNVFYDCMTTIGYEQCNYLPTRNDSVLDLVFSNDPFIISSIYTDCPFSTSDHSTVVFGLLINEPADFSGSCYCNSVGGLDFENADYDSIYSYLLLLDWECLFSECSCMDDMLSVFLKVINDSLINNIGVKKVQHRKSKKRNILKLYLSYLHVKKLYGISSRKIRIVIQSRGIR